FNGFGRGSGSLQSGGGVVSLIGDVIDLGAANSITSTAGGTLVFEPYDAKRPIDLGNTPDQAGALKFTQTDNAAIVQGGANGFGSLVIGRSDGTGLVSTKGDLQFHTNVTIESSGAGSAGITVTNALDTAGSDLTLLGGPDTAGSDTGLLGGPVQVSGS